MEPVFSWFDAYIAATEAHARDITRWNEMFRELNDKLIERENELAALVSIDNDRIEALNQAEKTEKALRNEIAYLRKYYRYMPRDERNTLKGGAKDGVRVGHEGEGLEGPDAGRAPHG